MNKTNRAAGRCQVGHVILLVLSSSLFLLNHPFKTLDSFLTTAPVDLKVAGPGENVMLTDKVTATATVDGDFELAASQSYGFFNDVPAKSWNLHRGIYRQSTNHLDPMNPLANSKFIGNVTPDWLSVPGTWYQDNYEPNFNCAFEKRIGGKTMNGDGPKWVCDPHRIKRIALERKEIDPLNRGCVVYSIGSNGDFNFELGMQNEIGEGICEFHIFDMGNFSSEMPNTLKRAHYHQWGLKKQDPNVDQPLPGETFYGLRDTIKLLGHDDLEVIDIFKIDCESCEWETYMDWLSEGIPILHQILVETHDAPDEALGLFDTLEAAGYLRYHKEANLLVTEHFRAYNQCIEYGMVKVSTNFMNGKIYTFNTTKFQMVDGNIKPFNEVE